MKTKKISNLQLFLTVFFVGCLLISNVITSKQVQLPFGITMTGAVFIFPITYILSDIFSEVYGYKWSRMTCYLGFLMNLFMIGIFQILIITPAPDYWTHQEAFKTVLGSTPRIFVASILAMLFGDFINDKVFKKFKDKHPNDHKNFGFRAILSSLCGELADSLIFMPIAFIGQMPASTLIVMSVVQVSIKCGYELLILPLTRFIVHKISAYESTIKEE
jgi:uncharacterized integral membrane protein (TIGR00697 family)